MLKVSIFYFVNLQIPKLRHNFAGSLVKTKQILSMTNYSTELFDLTNNPNCTFYKLYVNGKCEFDDFLEEIKKNIADKDSMDAIIAYMDILSAQLLPAKKYNHIVGAKRSDLYEFKNKKLRVYVIDQKPNIFIVMGGYKNTQKKDIPRLIRKTKDFPKNKTNNN